jgi:beta-lactamase regulating signal transducer with metallopeptidase domain
MVPASAVAAVLPAPSGSWVLTTIPVPARIMALAGASAPARYAIIGLLVWAGGACVMLALAVRRQRRFERSLGRLTPLANGAYKGASVAEPMLIGALHPRVVLPPDFETRYTPEECALVLAHERAHLRRGDALANAVASGCLCLSWFNPLMYWALAQFRFDQELACDASVLAATGTARRQYADALLKAQLAADAVRFVPAGCAWRSSTRLKQRIAVLKRPLPSYVRRAAGVLLALACIGSGSYVAWGTRAIATMVPAWTCPKIPPILQGSTAPRPHEWAMLIR